MSRTAIRGNGVLHWTWSVKVFGYRSGLWSAVLATGVVLFGPLAVSWTLLAHGAITSVWVSVVLGCAMSVAMCQLGGLCWERNRRSADLLFSDLLLWGWIRRRSMERRLTNAARLFPAASKTEARGDSQLDDPVTLLRQLAADLEASDPYTHGHSRRVARYASLIARRMDLPAAEVRRIRLAGALHDIGKLHTPRTILDKPGRLTDDEFAVVKRHPGDGADMIQRVIDDRELVTIVRHHHERLDGRGYPSGLAADGIPLGARIIAVADTFDAITSHRSYRRSRPHKAALDIMHSEAGTQLDPDAVRAFRSAYFGRRWLWIPAAAVNGAARLLAGVAAHVADTAAIAAGAAAIGATPLIVPMAPGTTSSPTHTSRLASGAGRNIGSTAPILGRVPHRIGAGIMPAGNGGSQRGQLAGQSGSQHGQTHHIGLTALPGHRAQPVSTAPRGAGGPSGSGGLRPGSPGSAGGPAGSPAASSPPSNGTGGGSGGASTISAAGTTVTTGPHGATASTSVPGTAATGASVAASSSATISASASAAGSSVGVTLQPGLPAPSLSVHLSLPTPLTVPTRLSLPTSPGLP
ncbi:MAG: hypothetical protein QOF83_1073 [Solirubrobacteraceae bacterium]|jgi:putative nucleotidyltransferase with HDIG domain|nr:hypothetical protein [Solirubrobacteraceae bacterium]